MSPDDVNSTEVDVSEAEKHSADLLEPLTGPERCAVLDSLIAWCKDRPVNRSDVADMVDFHFGIIDQEELVRRSGTAAQRNLLCTPASVKKERAA
jgi:hypothetical protein